MRSVHLILLGCLASGLSIAQPRTVALTFDDLPAAGATTAAKAERLNSRILRSLRERGAPATGFVVEKKGQEIGAAAWDRILRAWVRNGHELGNHTYSHADLNDITATEFETEVVAGEHSFAKVLAERARRPRFLRFPYNHSGGTKETFDAAAAFLHARGYVIAACTIDNSDYEFSRAYDLMLAHRDKAAAARLRRAYLDYTASEIDYYSGLHRQIFREEIPHVMLLHINRLNADVMDAMLGVFADKGYRFVTLAEAQSHPAYRTPIAAPTRFGPMWGYRWAQAVDVKVDGRLEPQPPAWVLQYLSREAPAPRSAQRRQP